MRPLRAWFARLGGLFAKQRRDRELADELESHVQLHIDENLRAGMPPEEARRQALIQLGGVEQTKESYRDRRSLPWLETLLQDIRFGLRMLRKNPGFTTVAVLTLALGIGANTAIFSVVNAVLLRPLPYRDSSRLVWATERFPFNRGGATVISPDFVSWNQQNDVFAKIAAFGNGAGANLSGITEPVRVRTTGVTTNFFDMLGIQPALGRHFLPGEGKLADSHVALLDETLWRNRFGADPHILGKAITLDRVAYTVVGVMPAGIRYPGADLWTPLALDGDFFSPQSPRWMGLTVVGLLKPGVTIDQAQSNLQVLIHRMDEQYPPQAAQFRANARAEVIPLHELLVRNVRSLLIVLLGAVGLVLLIACANVANLLLSRGMTRAPEITMRATLGAGRWRLLRQMLTESLLLGALGCLLGVFIGVGGSRTLEQLVPPDLPSTAGTAWGIFGFAAALAVLSVLLFGLVPALIASSSNVGEWLKNMHPGNGRKGSRLRAALVLAEISLSVVLLAGAGLLVRSFLRLTDVDLGFSPSHLLLGTVQRPLTLGVDSHQDAIFFQEALERVRALPGIDGAAIAGQYPLELPNEVAMRVRLADGSFYDPGQPILLDGISPGYFQTVGIRLLDGRLFNNGDSDKSPPVAILSASFARQAFKDRDTLGQRFSAGPNAPALTVVGVVSDSRNLRLDQAPIPEIFMPYLQHPSFEMTFVLRGKGDPRGLASSLRQAIFTLDKNQPLTESQTMDDLLAHTVAPQRFRMLLVGLFALLALVLAAVGIYSVSAYTAAQRTHEIGVRMALGAQPRNILKLVLGEAALLALCGVGIGIAGAFWLTRFISGMLYGVKATDAVTFICASMLITFVVVVASYIPARRAMRVDPMVALRYE